MILSFRIFFVDEIDEVKISRKNTVGLLDFFLDDVLHLYNLSLKVIIHTFSIISQTFFISPFDPPIFLNKT